MAESRHRSNNPFRRNTAAGTGSTPASPPAEQPTTVFDTPSVSSTVTHKQFPTHPQAMAQSQPPPATTFQKPKVAKKVRVQSPPPSSPSPPASTWDAAEMESFRLDGADMASGGATQEANRFWAVVAPGFRDTNDEVGGVQAPGRFGRTHEANQDKEEADSSLEHTTLPQPGVPVQGKDAQRPGQAGASHAEVKAALDVSAFSRLLLTGSRVDSARASPTAGDYGSITDASSVSRHSLFDLTHSVGETPRTSHEISDQGEDEQLELLGQRQPTKQRTSPGTVKKKPRPPNSRHGKLIRETKTHHDGQATDRNAVPLALPTWDVNKPLPLAPVASLEGTGAGSFDRDAAGRVPDLDVDANASIVPSPRPPTPPNTSRVRPTRTGSISKKPTPPPRRQPQARADTKVANPTEATHHPDDSESTTRRSSMDSTRSRSSSLRVNPQAPAPPPPRRPAPSSRSSSSFVLPSSPSFTGAGLSSVDSERRPSYSSSSDVTLPGLQSSSPATSSEQTNSASHISRIPPPSRRDGTFKTGPPPPPPPARHSSVRHQRRPPSISSIEATSKKTSRDGGAPPPPPPPRQRGGSKGSLELSSSSASVDGNGRTGGVLMEQGERVAIRGYAPPSAANDIMADLAALQRDVDLALQRETGSVDVAR